MPSPGHQDQRETRVFRRDVEGWSSSSDGPIGMHGSGRTKQPFRGSARVIADDRPLRFGQHESLPGP